MPPSRCHQLWLSGTALAVLAACHEPSAARPNSAEPPHAVAPLASASSTAAALPSQTPGAPVSGSESEPAASAEPVTSATAEAGGAPVVASPAATSAANSALIDADGKPLPQTDQKPSLTSAAFQQRIAAVAQAIISGDTEPALAAFFPLVAYQQVKDVAKPERDYRFRLLAYFKRDILEYHHALGAGAAAAKFSGVTVSERDAKWMAPGSEGNKLGYFRVLRSRLHFTLPAGRSHDFELTSLISWRGEWYVVHLHGFK